MTDWRDTSAAWLRDMRQEHMSRSISYKRGESTTAGITVTPVLPRILSSVDGEIAISSEGRDWLIPAADLKIDDVATRPVAGDEIIDGSEVWIVADDETGRPWEYLDTTEIMYRIHTKRVAGSV